MGPLPLRHAIVAAVVAILAASALPAAVQRGRAGHPLLVTAIVDAATPATGLTAADFRVREDGRAREILRVEPAPPPSHVVLLVDDSQAAERSIPFLRAGLAAFVARMTARTPAPQLSLMTVGDRPTMRAAFAPTADAVQSAAARLFAVPGSGSYLLQAIVDASAACAKRQAADPVIVAFTVESGPEFSPERREQVADALKTAHASLWPIVLQSADRLDQTPEGLERAAVLGDVATRSGGVARVILSNESVEPAYEGVAALIASRYLVTYARPDELIPPASVEIATTKSGVRVVASRWIR